MKRSIHILGILLILLFPFTVKANELISIECVKDNNEYSCLVYGIPEYPIRAIDFKYSLPKYVIDSSFVLDERIIGRTDGNWISALFEDLTYEKILIGTLKIKTNKELNSNDIIISDEKIVNENYEDVIINDNINNNVNRKESSRWLLKIIIPCVIIIIGIMIFIFVKMRGGKK